MTFKVLVVDDSGFFRRRLGELINSCNGLKVVGTASNGREAIDQVLKLKPDVITMDYEMPVMDGISAVRHIMDQCPTPILMFSSLTYEGARVTLDSLDAGAVDYLPKNFEEISKSSAVLKRTLEERLIVVAKSKKSLPAVEQKTPEKPVVQKTTTEAKLSPRATAPKAPVPSRARKRSKPYRLVAIGTSTGGPVALQSVLSALPANFPLPVILIQHMPSTFTSAFAQRLDSLCKISIKEAKDGDILKPGVALLAPGGKQLMVAKGGRIKVLPGDERLNYKPSVDVAFGSAANAFEDAVLGVVLTGMGSDGCEGAKLLKQKGSSIWAQDESTSVIYGMPMAIAKANLADEILPLQKVASRLCEVV
jgi:two-component system, chemotaxis family, protein-glutamate methylesterase/glutaminase